MSKYSDDLEATFKDVEALKQATGSVVREGKELAFKGYYKAKDFIKLETKLKGVTC